MMLQALIEYAERREKETPGFCDPDLEWVNVSWQLSLNSSGRLSAIIPLTFKQGKRDIPRRMRRPYTDTNKISVRSLLKAQSYFLCDTLERVLCFNDDGSASEDPLVLARNSYFISLLTDALATSPNHIGAKAILDFLTTPSEVSRARTELANANANGSSNVSFAVDGHDILSDAFLIEWWRTRRKNNPEEAHAAVSLVSGMWSHCKKTASKIKGIGDGDTLLISANESAFSSYTLEKAENSAITEKEDKQIKAALDELIARSKSQGLVFNDTVYIHWMKDPGQVDHADLLFEPDPERIAALLHSVKTGQKTADADDTAYYCAGLSGNGARIVVRDWIETKASDVARSIAAWFEAISIIHEDSALVRNDFKFGHLLDGMIRSKIDKLPPQIPTQLIHAALFNTPLPRIALAAALRRQQLDGGKPNPERLALIKAYLLRSPNRKETHTMTEKLDTTSKDKAYLCGQLFAIIGRLQLLALGKIGASVAERTYGGVATHPATTLGPIFTKVPAYIKKANTRFPGSGTNKQKELECISCQIETQGGLPKTLGLEEQGRFALGYYCQLAQYRADRIEEAAAREAEKMAEEN